MKLNITFAKTGLALLTLVASSATLQPAFAQNHSAMAGTKMTSKMAMMSFSGSFKQITHATKGTATLSGRTIKLSNFETGMGPQLHVYLVPSGATSNNAVKALVAAKKFVDLGALKSIKGNQSYAIPASGKAAKGSSVIVWCDKFDVVFGAATLS